MHYSYIWCAVDLCKAIGPVQVVISPASGFCGIVDALSHCMHACSHVQVQGSGEHTDSVYKFRPFVQSFQLLADKIDNNLHIAISYVYTYG